MGLPPVPGFQSQNEGLQGLPTKNGIIRVVVELMISHFSQIVNRMVTQLVKQSLQTTCCMMISG